MWLAWGFRVRRRWGHDEKEFKPPEGNFNLLQKAKAVSNLVDVVVRILPWVDVHPILPALRKAQHQIKMIFHSNSIKVWQMRAVLFLISTLCLYSQQAHYPIWLVRLWHPRQTPKADCYCNHGLTVHMRHWHSDRAKVLRLTRSYFAMISARSSAIRVSMSFFMSKSVDSNVSGLVSATSWA